MPILSAMSLVRIYRMFLIALDASQKQFLQKYKEGSYKSQIKGQDRPLNG